jgi:hypothetical protein
MKAKKGVVHKLWCVRDATRDSELADVLFVLRMTAHQLAAYIVGCPSQKRTLGNICAATEGIETFKREHHTFYFDHASAVRDANRRLAKARKETL